MYWLKLLAAMKLNCIFSLKATRTHCVSSVWCVYAA